jgi:hypothetical protein
MGVAVLANVRIATYVFAFKRRCPMLKIGVKDYERKDYKRSCRDD